MNINLEDKLKHAVQEKVVPADNARSNDTIEDIIECTFCAEPMSPPGYGVDPPGIGDTLKISLR